MSNFCNLYLFLSMYILVILNFLKDEKWKNNQIKRKSLAKVLTLWIWRTVCMYSFSNIHSSNVTKIEEILRTKTIHITKALK